MSYRGLLYGQKHQIILRHFIAWVIDAVEAALDMSAHQVHLDFDISRVAACPIEMRSSLGAVDKIGRLCLTTSAQSPFALHDELAKLFKLPKDQIRVLVPDVGGSFGMKGTLYREDALVVWAAKHLNKPVYWAAIKRSV